MRPGSRRMSIDVGNMAVNKGLTLIPMAICGREELIILQLMYPSVSPSLPFSLSSSHIYACINTRWSSAAIRHGNGLGLR